MSRRLPSYARCHVWKIQQIPPFLNNLIIEEIHFIHFFYFRSIFFALFKKHLEQLKTAIFQWKP